MLPPQDRRDALTIEPPGVVLICAHGRLLSKSAEDGCVGAHEVDVHARIQLLICGRPGVSQGDRPLLGPECRPNDLQGRVLSPLQVPQGTIVSPAGCWALFNWLWEDWD